MRILTPAFIKEAAVQYPKAASYLAKWLQIVDEAEWQNLVDVRREFPSADPVKVKSGHTVIVFNVCGNTYRLITSLHYRGQRAYTHKFLTHAEYSKNTWKNDL